MLVVMLGPPGSGKGTQAVDLARAAGIAHVSTGQILREAVRMGTALGQQVKLVLDAGQLVDDALVDSLVTEKLGMPECARGAIFDGYPRNVSQAEVLDRCLSSRGLVLRAAALIDVPDDVIVRRLSGRRSCPQCGGLYHVSSKPPRTEGVCDGCHAKLEIRSDDRESVVRDRLQVYHGQTEPVVAWYRARGLLVAVDGTRSIGEVTASLVKVLGIEA